MGIGGQGPSDHPDLAKWLMEQGIDSVSLNPDSAARSNLLGLREPARAPNKDDKDGELTVKLLNIGIFHQEVELKPQRTEVEHD